MRKTSLIKEGVLSLIGNTPLIRLKHLFPEFHFDVFAKMEMENPGGSIKDRTSYHMISHALKEGRINGDTVIIESTSGNMGIGLAQICLLFGLRLILVIDPHINAHAQKILQAYGAELVMVTDNDGLGGYLNTRLLKVKALLEYYPNSYNPDQYHNRYNPLAHQKTAQEIIDALGEFPDYIFIPTSTCGTLMGFAEAMHQRGAHTKIIAVDAVGSIIFDDKPQLRRIPGMGSSRASNFLDQRLIHDVMHISDEEMVIGCHKILQKESILAGGSSGAVVMAIEKWALKIPSNARVIGIFADRGERYLDSIFDKAWIELNFPNALIKEQL